METNNPSMQQQMLNVLGGVPATARHILGAVIENVTVRVLKISQTGRYAQLVEQDDEAGMISLFVDKKPAWVEGIHPEDALRILELGTELNEPFLRAFLARQATRKALLPKSPRDVAMEKMLAQMGPGLLSALMPGSPASVSKQD